MEGRVLPSRGEAGASKQGHGWLTLSKEQNMG